MSCVTCAHDLSTIEMVDKICVEKAFRNEKLDEVMKECHFELARSA